MTSTKIHLSEAFSKDTDPPGIQTYLFADKDSKVVTMDIGEAGRGMFSLSVTPRSARKLGQYLVAFADTADDVAVSVAADPTNDAPAFTDVDFIAPAPWAA